MRIYREKDYDAMSRRAANIISAEVIRRPDCVLGLATGSTPIGTYKQLAAWNQRGDFSFKEVHSVNLDEYKGLSGDHDQSYRYFMQKNLFDHIDILPENTYVPSGLAEDPEEECRRYGKTGRRSPRTASSAMCTFMIINVSSLQLIPLNMIAYRTKYGSADPAAIVGPAILATAVSTAVAVVFCKIMDGKRG